MTLLTGSILQGGKYIISQTLGQGGFGITYEAEQVSLHRQVAIKEFFMSEYCNRDSTTSYVTLGASEGSKELVEKFRTKFVREAQMIAGLDNPHIIKIHDIFEENGTAYYVMPFLDGGSLADKVKQNGPMQEQEAIDYIKQIGDALDYLHKQSILHLDIKPSNVLLNTAGEAVLIDFGISKHYDEAGSQTSTTPVGISKGYAPMEQYQQGSVTKFSPATDIYSLGATLFYLLTGTTPPEAADVYEEGLPVISGLIGAPTYSAIRAAMEPKRKDRPQSIDAFVSLFHLSNRHNQVREEQEITTTLYVPQSSPSPEDKTIIIEQKKATNKDKDTSNKGRSKSKITLLLCFCMAVLIVLSVFFIPKFSHSLPSDQKESITIEGALSFRVSFDAEGGNKTFRLQKSFNDDWTYSKLPEWCSIHRGSTSFTILCSENTSSSSRSANIFFSKEGSSEKMATLIIMQSDTISNDGSSSNISSSSIASSNSARETSKEEMSISKDCLSIKVGASYSLTATNYGSSIRWSSNNEQIATVSSSGVVTGKAPGSAIVYAQGIKTLSCRITVISTSEASISTKPATIAATNRMFTINVNESLESPMTAEGRIEKWEAFSNADCYKITDKALVGVKAGGGDVWAYINGTPIIYRIIVKQLSTSEALASTKPATTTAANRMLTINVNESLVSPMTAEGRIEKWEAFSNADCYKITGKALIGVKAGGGDVWAYINGTPIIYRIVVKQY